ESRAATGGSSDLTVSERVVVLAPRGRDAAVAESILREAGIERQVVTSFTTLTAELVAGAGAAVIADEAADDSRIDELRDWIAGQPAWSDFPFVFLTRRDVSTERHPYLLHITETLATA